MLSNLKQYLVGEPEWRAVQLGLSAPLRYPVADRSGVLVRVRPHETSSGIAGARGFFRAMHDVEPTWWGRNTSTRHAFETRFEDGKLTFYLYAATAEAAADFQRRLWTHYPESEVTRVTDEAALPVVQPGDYVAGAYLTTTHRSAYPLRSPATQGFASDPYGDLTQELLAQGDTRLVVQVVLRPAKPSWADGRWLRRDSLEEIAHSLRQGTSVGWLPPRTRPASSEDKQAATAIEAQRGRPAFHTSLRILAISPTEHSARARAEGIARLFSNHYTGVAGQSLTATPIWHPDTTKQATRLREHLGRLAAREWTPRGMVLTVPELAAVAHLPNGDVSTPHIDWCQTQHGDRVPPDAPTYDPTTDDTQPAPQSTTGDTRGGGDDG